MSPQKFEINQAVTFSVRATQANLTEFAERPTLGDIFHVHEFVRYDDARIAWVDTVVGEWYVVLKERPNTCYCQTILEPVELTTADVEALMEQTLPIEI